MSEQRLLRARGTLQRSRGALQFYSSYRRQLSMLRLVNSARGSSCRVCSCTDWDCSGCIQRTGTPCHWVEPDLCSACVVKP